MSKPKPHGADSRRPWKNMFHEITHPDAPHGSGGPGFFQDARGHGRGAVTEDDAPGPHPDSPNGRHMVAGFDELDDLDPPPVYMDSEVSEKAEDLVGKSTVRTTTPKGLPPECFDLVDHIYKEIGAKPPKVPPGQTLQNADYIWGEEIKLSEVQAGSILQLRDHKIIVVVDVTTLEEYQGGKIKIDDGDPAAGIDEKTYKRGHHTAVVSKVLPDGELFVIEQHVTDRETGKLTEKVLRNQLYTQSSSKKTVKKKSKTHPKYGKGTLTITTKTTITVSGKIIPYRSLKKPEKTDE